MRYKVFGRSGLRVSEFCLGTMTFGREWGRGADKEESRKIFNLFTEAGGNFIDTANRYTEGTSERFLSEFIGNDRHRFVLGTKYSLFTNPGDPNDGGNHRKNMIYSVEQSLKRLKTDYADILYLHAWDAVTPAEEFMRGMDDLVRAGKVHYIAVADTPAWVISRADMLADLRGWSSFIGMQTEYSLTERSPERELLPMASALNLGLTVSAPLGGGILGGDPPLINEFADKSEQEKINFESRIAEENAACAAAIGCTPAQLALAWLHAKQPDAVPVLSAATENRIRENLQAFEVVIPPEIMLRLEQVSQIPLGFPHEFLNQEKMVNFLFGGYKSRLDSKQEPRI